VQDEPGEIPRLSGPKDLRAANETSTVGIPAGANPLTPLISNILPEYKENELKYIIGYGDRHSNALARGLIARYVIERLLGQ
jgi:hypothetical protein